MSADYCWEKNTQKFFQEWFNKSKDEYIYFYFSHMMWLHEWLCTSNKYGKFTHVIIHHLLVTFYVPVLIGGDTKMTPSPRTNNMGIVLLVDWKTKRIILQFKVLIAKFFWPQIPHLQIWETVRDVERITLDTCSCIPEAGQT